MAWTTVTRQRRTRRTWDGQHQLAKSLLDALLTTRQKPKQQAEWVCDTCGASNFMWRKTCRRCPPAKPAPPAKSQQGAQATSGLPPLPKPAPWAKARAAASQATALEAALSAARLAGGDAELAEELQRKLDAARKASTDSRPLDIKLSGCRDFISRARKRLEKAEQIIKDATQHRDNLRQDLDEHEKTLKELEDEAAKARNPTSMAVEEAEATEPDIDLAKLQQQLATMRSERDSLFEQATKAQSESAKLRSDNKVYISEGKKLQSRIGALEEERAAESGALKRQHSELRSLGSSELMSRLDKCFRDHQAALGEQSFSAARALWETMGKLTAALEEAEPLEAQAGSVFNPAS